MNALCLIPVVMCRMCVLAMVLGAMLASFDSLISMNGAAVSLFFVAANNGCTALYLVLVSFIESRYRYLVNNINSTNA